MEYRKDAILIIEDAEEPAKWQATAATSIFPDKRVIHVTNLEDAHDVLHDPDIHVFAIITDNDSPARPDGSTLSTDHDEEETLGIGALLVRQLREGFFGRKYRKVRVVLHDHDLEKAHVSRILAYDALVEQKRTHCFASGKDMDAFRDMMTQLKPAMH